ncbi:MAG: hypothetical protein ABSF61_10130 [Anaerolineales bacterium]|jgi:hypothetical protein
MTIDQLLSLLGIIFRPLGFLVFGFAAGWLATRPFVEEQKWWQLEALTLIAFFGALVTLSIYVGPGSVGAFALGAGIAVIVFGMRLGQKPSGGETVTRK